jgi:cell division protein FtsB
VGAFLRRWWPVAVLALLLLVLQSKFWLGAGGWREARELQDSVSAQRAENARLQQRNDALSAEVEDLKSGETAVEERARSELGMIKPGETFYRVVEPHTVRAPADAPAAGAGAPDEATPDGTGDTVTGDAPADAGDASAPDAADAPPAPGAPR